MCRISMSSVPCGIGKRDEAIDASTFDWSVYGSDRSKVKVSAWRKLFCHMPYCFNDEMRLRQLNVVTTVMGDLMLSLRRTSRQLPLNLRPASNSFHEFVVVDARWCGPTTAREDDHWAFNVA